VLAGHNPGVHGAVLTEALSSRFTFQFDVATDYELARSLGIDSRAITAARNLATRQANGETGSAPQLLSVRRTAPEPEARGHIADGGNPESRLKTHNRIRPPSPDGLAHPAAAPVLPGGRSRAGDDVITALP
jgi:hypothetical protein